MGRGESRPSGNARGQTARFGLWRAIAATPAMLGSLLLLTLASGALGRWAGLLFFAWAAGAAVLMTRVGERITVRAACRFRSPSRAQAAALQPAWSTALRTTGTAASDVDLYVQTAQTPNAYAAGGRSVAVTSRVLEDYESGQLAKDQFVAVLVHELGHHATGAARPMLLVSFLAAPWRLAASLLTGLANTLAGRQPRARSGHRRGRRTGHGRDARLPSGPVVGRGSAGLRRAGGGALSPGRRRDQPAVRVRRRPVRRRPRPRAGAGRRTARDGRRPERGLRMAAAASGLPPDLRSAHPRTPRGDWVLLVQCATTAPNRHRDRRTRIAVAKGS